MPHDKSSYRTILPGLPPEAYAWLERPMPRPTGLTWHAAVRLAERLPMYFVSGEHARALVEPLLIDAEPNPFPTLAPPADAGWAITYRRHSLMFAVTGEPRRRRQNILTALPRMLTADEPPLHQKYRWNPVTRRFDFRHDLRRPQPNRERYAYDGRANAGLD